ncbi:MAG: hypothetical protein OXE87_00695 [Chloroflexi bacterium]|nr:hypothetical protein [Chloroflexota bacterium]
MTSKTRKHIWPVALMSLAVFGVLAAVVALSVISPRTSLAHGCDDAGTAIAQAQCIAEHVAGGIEDPSEDHSHGDDGTGTPPVIPEAASDKIASSSTSGGASVKLTLTLDDPGALRAGSSVVLYLEDDFQVGDIDMSKVYFVGRTTGRVYVTDAVVVDDDDHFGGDDDWDIQVFVPDRNPGNDTGFDSWSDAQASGIKLVLDKAGVKNPTEAGTHSVGYSVLSPDESVGDPEVKLDDVEGSGAPLATLAKISLSDEDAGRGTEITVTGTGFNNGTGAEVYVLIADTKPESCEALVGNSDAESLGEASVGSDDKFVVTFTVHQDEFDAGPVNHICAVDSEAGSPRFSSDVDTFDLEPSVTVSPDSANFGDEVTVKPRDFTQAISSITLGPTCAWTSASGNTDCFTPERDGSDFVFDLPGGLSEQIQIAVADGVDTKRIYMGVVPSSLDLSQTEVAPNASIIISGSGFTENSTILVSNITIDDEPLVVSDAGTEDSGADRHVKVTSSGEFSATVRVWTDSSSSNNPTLDDGTYTVKVVDQGGFEGEVDITILEPTVTVAPETASPRDFIVISGTNWPISTADQDNSVTIEVDGRTRNADIGSTGRFRYEYQLRSTIKIGDEHDVTVTYEDGRDDIEEETSFNVTPAHLTITPAAAGPGQTISIGIEGMPPYTLVDEVRIDGANRLGNRNVNTDLEGDATVTDILVPFLDPGFYPVEVRVGNETRVAQFEVLAEAGVPGVAMALPDAVVGLGDNLDAIFHFNNTSKEWTFYDPRPEFAELNTLNELNTGQPYWVLVKDSQEDVDWNGRLVNFTCAGGDCWNLEIW